MTKYAILVPTVAPAFAGITLTSVRWPSLALNRGFVAQIL